MAYGPLDLLSYVPLMAPVETIKTGIPDVFPPEFWSTREQVPGNVAMVIERPNSRKVARIAPYGSPPRLVDKVNLSERPLTLLHTIEQMVYRDEFLRILRAWDKYEPQHQRFKDELVFQARQFVERQDRLDVATLTAFLANGVAYFDGNGNLLPTSSGQKLTIDQGIPAANKNQLNGLISASWATANTNIVAQINALKVFAIQSTGYKLKYAFYGKNIPGYFAANDSIKLLWAYNQAMNTNYLSTGRMPNEMLELIWLPAQNAFFEDDNGVVQPLFPDDGVTFTPEINASTYAYLEGSNFVPKSYGVTATPEAALSNFEEVFGRFRYAYPRLPVPAIVDVTGNTFMTRFKVPNAFFCADVTP